MREKFEKMRQKDWYCIVEPSATFLLFLTIGVLFVFF